MARTQPFDRTFFISIVTAVAVGFLIFASASLGLLAREGVQFSDIAFKQFLVGIVGGGVALLAVSSIKYRTWRKYAFYFFIAALGLTALVFIPQLGPEINGARRWVHLGAFSFQPSEILKLAYVIYLATWLSAGKIKVEKLSQGLIPFCTITGIVGILLLLQPDTGTFLVIAAAGTAIYFAAGAKMRDFALLACIAILGIATLALVRPYVAERIETFFNPESDPHGSSYQLRQSLIAIGSGGVLGRGFGQSVQKFNYLPEPVGDSIFAVYAEEFGLVGGVALLLLFLFIAMRGYRIATRAPDSFGVLLVVGITSLIAAQSFVNIGSMLGILPLTGVPLPFVSHGGTSMLILLAGVGIVLNVSRHAKAG